MGPAGAQVCEHFLYVATGGTMLPAMFTDVTQKENGVMQPLWIDSTVACFIYNYKLFTSSLRPYCADFSVCRGLFQ